MPIYPNEPANGLPTGASPASPTGIEGPRPLILHLDVDAFFAALLEDPSARATLVALWALRTMFANQESEWKLIFAKAVTWLRVQAERMGVPRATFGAHLALFLAAVSQSRA